jgi:hypothetical protein
MEGEENDKKTKENHKRHCIKNIDNEIIIIKKAFILKQDKKLGEIFIWCLEFD